MKFKITLDKSGRIVLPKSILKQMELIPGDELRIESNDDAVTLRPTRRRALLTKGFGIWVYQDRPSSQSIGSLIDKERLKRLRNLVS